MSRENGFFEAFINENVQKLSASDRKIMQQVTVIIRETLKKEYQMTSQVHWAGSQRKNTSTIASDLDFCVETKEPINTSQRKKLRVELEKKLNRPVRILSHAIRIPEQRKNPKVDIAFSNAAFGSRPLPDKKPFKNNKARQMTVRALKIWGKSARLPRLSGWAVEALVIFFDSKNHKEPLGLFLNVVKWIETCSPQSVESILRPHAKPKWDPKWSKPLAKRLESFRNGARALLRSKNGPMIWKSSKDVGRWFGR